MEVQRPRNTREYEQGKDWKKFLDKKRGNFSLYIKNVSDKYVGNYTCLAKVSAGRSKTNDDEDYVELLPAWQEGGVSLTSVTLITIPFNRSTAQQVTLSLGQCCQSFFVFPTMSGLLIKYNEIKFFSEKI